MNKTERERRGRREVERKKKREEGERERERGGQMELGREQKKECLVRLGPFVHCTQRPVYLAVVGDDISYPRSLRAG